MAEDDHPRAIFSWLQGAGYDVTACSSGLDLRAQLERSVISSHAVNVAGTATPRIALSGSGSGTVIVAVDALANSDDRRVYGSQRTRD